MKTAKWMTIGLAAVMVAAVPQWTLAKDRGKSGKDGNVGRTTVARERSKSGKDGNTGKPDDGRNRSRSGKDRNTGGSSNITLTPGHAVQHGHGKAEGDNGQGDGKGGNAHGGNEGENGHGGPKGRNEPEGAEVTGDRPVGIGQTAQTAMVVRGEQEDRSTEVPAGGNLVLVTDCDKGNTGTVDHTPELASHPRRLSEH